MYLGEGLTFECSSNLIIIVATYNYAVTKVLTRFVGAKKCDFQ